MSAPWEKYANSFCHQKENRGQGSSTYRRGLREEGTCKRRDWLEGDLCVCTSVDVSVDHRLYGVDWGVQEREVSQLVYIIEPE